MHNRCCLLRQPGCVIDILEGHNNAPSFLQEAAQCTEVGPIRVQQRYRLFSLFVHRIDRFLVREYLWHLWYVLNRRVES